MNLADGAYVEQLLDLFIDDFVALGSELASLLFDWRMVGVDLESVYYYVWVDSCHERFPHRFYINSRRK